MNRKYHHVLPIHQMPFEASIGFCGRLHLHRGFSGRGRAARGSRPGAIPPQHPRQQQCPLARCRLPQLQQSEANLERDRAQLRRFQSEVARQTGLANRGIAPAQKLEDVMTSEAVFEATVRASEAAMETTRINLKFRAIHYRPLTSPARVRMYSPDSYFFPQYFMQMLYSLLQASRI